MGLSGFARSFVPADYNVMSLYRPMNRLVLNYIRRDLAKFNTRPGMYCGIVREPHNVDAVLKLRYNAYVRDAKQPLPDNHPFIVDGDKFTDEYDTFPDTMQLSCILNNRAISTVRMIDGNHRDFECEKYKQFDMRGSVKHLLKNPDNIVETTRIAVDINHRSGFAFPLIACHTYMYGFDNNIECFYGQVNSSAEKLISHYIRLFDVKLISPAPFNVEEFAKGRQCVGMIQRLTDDSSTRPNETVLYKVLVPVFVYYKVLYWRHCIIGR